MKIYTKTGDSGETSLFGGGRVYKSHLRIQSYGTVDELNSLIGLSRSEELQSETESVLEELQTDLFVLGADLATPADSKAQTQRIQAEDVEKLEQWIDRFDDEIPPLKHFILPGGTPGASHLHVARTVCRRAERYCVEAKQQGEDISGEAIKFLNRLSDFLFVLARYENLANGIDEKQWKPES
ncbi:MAG: cob(I)yrinic acid a,c-diamide adenosyltransferase [Bacteroidota bacterium]